MFIEMYINIQYENCISNIAQQRVSGQLQECSKSNVGGGGGFVQEYSKSNVV